MPEAPPVARPSRVVAIGAVGVAVLCAVAVGLFALSANTATRSAPGARPMPLPARSGQATYYTLAAGGGNCSYAGPPADNLYVALGPTEYASAARCGGYLDVTGPNGTVRVKVIDQCPECAPGHLDLSYEAFTRLGSRAGGIIPITYRTVRDPTLPGPLQVRVQEGSSRYWLALVPVNHGNPLAGVEVRGTGDWQVLHRTGHNYWLAEHGAGGGPFTLRLTDTEGHRAVVAGVPLSPGKVQNSAVRMY
jgi:expansin (peptidoglycan-binding protein)